MPVLMSSALISGDVLPPSVLGPPDCDDERRAPAVKSGVPLLATMSDVLPPSSLGSNSSRCLLSNGFVPRFPFTNASSRHSPSAVLRSSTSPFTACGPSVTDLDGCKQTLPAMASGGGGGFFVPSAVRSRRRSPDPQISARGLLAVAARLPQF